MRLLILLLLCGTLNAIEMRIYVMGMLYRGPKATAEVTETSKKLQAGHMANINKMAAEGHLLIAGPMGGQGELRGIFIFDTEDVKKAQEWCDQDPAIQAGTLRVELYQWYAAKGLTYDKSSEKKP